MTLVADSFEVISESSLNKFCLSMNYGFLVLKLYRVLIAKSLQLDLPRLIHLYECEILDEALMIMPV